MSRYSRTRVRAWAMGLALAGATLALPAVAQAAPNSAFVAEYQAKQAAHYSIGTGGDLSFSNSAPAGADAWMEAITPNAKYLYVANYLGATISQYSIGSDGTLTPLSPATASPGGNPYQIAVSPDGKNLYAANGTGLFTYQIGADGTLTQTDEITSGLSYPVGVAVSPDGSSVYVEDTGNSTIAEYNRSASGALTPKSTPSVPSDQSGDNVGALVMTPNGKSLYAADDSGNTIDQYTVGSGGQLAPDAVPAVVAPAPPGTAEFYALTVSPDGKSFYAPDYSNSAIYQYDISSTGELTPKSTPTVTGGSGAIFIWLNAAGTDAYVTNYGDNTISQFNVSSGGELTPKAQPTVSTGAGTSPISIMISPDQGPVAQFTSSIKGRKVSLNASKSSDSDGKVVSYHWDFGDGHTLTTSSPTVSHTYRKAGKHRITLTVSDDSGCSVSLVFTGQNAFCNGSAGARIRHTVKLTMRSLRLKVSPSRSKAGQRTCYLLRATSAGHGVKGTSVKLAGRTAHTGRSGTATLCLTLKKGTYTARASKSGYRTASARVHVTASSPAFTG